MRKSEAVKLPIVSSCHEVQGSVERKSFEFVPGMSCDNISSSSTDEISQVYRTIFWKTLVKVIFGGLVSLILKYRPH